jgi:hypothetical protein
VFALSGGLVLTLAIGCSDTDSPTGNLQMGDTTSAEFQFVEENLNGEDVFNNFELGLELSTQLLAEAGIPVGSPRAGALASAGVNDVIINSIIDWEFTADRWWVFNFEATISETDSAVVTQISVAGIDSVQLLLDGVAIDSSEVALGFDALKARAHVNWADLAQTVTASAHHRVDFSSAEVGNDSLITISGSVNDTVTLVWAGQDYECHLEVSSNQAVNNLVVLVSAAGDCPQSGSLSAVATLDLLCYGLGASQYNDLDIDGTWTMSVQVNDNQSATITYSDGTTAWVITENDICSSGV